MPQGHNASGSPADSDRQEATGVRPVRPWLLRLFRRWVVERRLRRQFGAVRVAFAERLPTAADGKLVFYLNHPSWWDPLLCMVLAKRFIPGRNFYAPIDAESLKRYGVLRNFGLFPVQTGSPRGAAQFLRAAEAVLRQGDVLGLTPQGSFTDVRDRPSVFKPGLGALMARLERSGETVTAVPIAIEYTFWNQRLPDVLVAVGRPLRTGAEGGTSSADSTKNSHIDAHPAVCTDPPRTGSQWTGLLARRLEETQDALGALSLTRERKHFDTLLQGGDGTAGLYGLWQKLRDCRRKEDFPKRDSAERDRSL